MMARGRTFNPSQRMNDAFTASPGTRQLEVKWLGGACCAVEALPYPLPPAPFFKIRETPSNSSVNALVCG